MQAWQVKFSVRATADLSKIAKWTSDTFGPQQAEAYIAKLKKHCENLSITSSKDLHFAVFKFRASARNGHRISWKQIDKNTIMVLRIIHTARNLI